MLPSTGYFKGINCPFYDSGLCERPYCHFRHVKKDSLTSQNDGIESGAMLQKLVSAAVQKVLQQTEVSAMGSSTQTLVNDAPNDSITSSTVHTTSKVTYNPTPISELKKIIKLEESEADEAAAEQRKRHIPVPYTPRKPASIPVKRPANETNGSSECEPLVYLPPPNKYTPGSKEAPPLDQYLPKGSVASTSTYLPGTPKDLQEYAPTQTQLLDKSNYTPSDKNVNRQKLLEYNPMTATKKHDTAYVKYEPTPKSEVPCFSSDEDEPEPKRSKILNDLNGLDDLGAEFDILGQILDEEKLDENQPIKIDTEMTLEATHHENLDTKEIKKENMLKTDSTEAKAYIKKNKVEKKDKSSSHKHDKSRERKSKKSKSEEKLKKRDEKKQDIPDKKHHKSPQKEKSVKVKAEDDVKDNPYKYDRNTSRKTSTSKSSKKHSKNHSKISSTFKTSKTSGSSKSHNGHSSSRSSIDSKKEKRKHGDEHKASMDESSKVQSDNLSDSADNVGDTCEPHHDDLATSSESDEETRALECKKIFEEYIPTVKAKVPVPENVADDINEDQYIPGKIRISRTNDKNIKVKAKAPIKPDFRVNAAQAMNDRLAKVREYHCSRNLSPPEICIQTTKSDALKSSVNPNSSSSKVRIAHVPYASTLVNAKKSFTPLAVVKDSLPSTSTTIVQTVKKGVQRTAHVPNEKFIDRPGVLEPLASKIPANIRSIYLNMMIDECLKIYIHPTDAYARAQHEELNTSKKCSKVQIYKNSAVLTVTRLRKELQECNGIKKTGTECSALQRIPQVSSGNANHLGSWSIESKYRGVSDNSKEFKGAKFYNNISKWVLTEEQLKENGFPMHHPNRERGRAIIYGQNKQKPPQGYIRTCCRCKKEFTVDKKGFPAVKQECIYHPNNKYRYRGEAKYQCCSQDGMSDGCCVAPCHVWEYVDYENLKGYVSTLQPEREMDDPGVYSLDCEMCYTTHGLDLTRITVIDSNCKVVYETLIKPIHPIIDYNTRYSGITEEQMAQVNTTLIEVQATLLTMFNSKTILIGHSLESDFKALKLIHGTVIDTSVLFPHKMGPPFKRALRNLSSEYLKKIIQNSVDGHDSAEDATVCMELLIYKLKEALKTR